MADEVTELYALYIRNLEHYTIEQLRYRYDSDVWSIGQMYVHVIEVAEEYIVHIETCANSTDEQHGGKTADGVKAFADRAWPDVRVKLDEPVDATRNPARKDELRASLEQVMEKLRFWAERIGGIDPSRKVRHGWFGWLDAREWYALAGMHAAHHLRQKARLDAKLAEAEAEGKRLRERET